MPRASLGERKALTVRVPLDLYEQLRQAGGTGNDNLTTVLRRGLVLDLTDDDLLDLTHLAEAVGFLDVPTMLRVICAREWHRLHQLRDEERQREAAESETSGPAQELAVEEPDEGEAALPPAARLSEPVAEAVEEEMPSGSVAQPITIEELRGPLPSPPPLPPRVKIWMPSRPEDNGADPVFPRRPLPPRR